MIEVYYVEDDENIALAVQEYLEMKNYRVKVLRTLADGRQVLRDRLPSVILVWALAC